MFPLTKGNFHLDEGAFKIKLKRHEGISLSIDFACDFGNLAIMKEEFSIPSRVFRTKAVRLVIPGNMHIFNRDLPFADKTKTVVHIDVAKA